MVAEATNPVCRFNQVIRYPMFKLPLEQRRKVLVKQLEPTLMRRARTQADKDQISLASQVLLGANRQAPRAKQPVAPASRLTLRDSQRLAPESNRTLPARHQALAVSQQVSQTNPLIHPPRKGRIQRL